VLLEKECLRYDREFLLQLRFSAESQRKPVGLPMMPEIILDMVSVLLILIFLQRENLSMLRFTCLIFPTLQAHLAVQFLHSVLVTLRCIMPLVSVSFLAIYCHFAVSYYFICWHRVYWLMCCSAVCHSLSLSSVSVLNVVSVGRWFAMSLTFSSCALLFPIMFSILLRHLLCNIHVLGKMCVPMLQFITWHITS